MGQYFLLSKGQKVHFRIPETWSVLNNVVLESVKPNQSVYEMVKLAIAEPIGTPSLANLIKPPDKIVILIDDFTRPTPKAEILACLVDHLRELGVGYDQIDILFSVGTHLPLSEAEMRKALGPGLVGKLRCTNHDCWSEDLVPVGTLKIGGELKVNSLLPAANFRIAVGSVLPHFMAGFGGGPKAVMPGVSDFEFIRRYHLSTFLPRLRLGETSGNPNYDGICEAARLARLDFIVNAVYSTQHEVMGIVAGDFEKAHKAGVQMSLEQYAVKVEPSADVTIISAFPYDESKQVLKSLVPAAIVTKKGGTIILVASASNDGQLPDPLFNAYEEVWAQVNGDPAKTAVEYIKQGRLIVQGGPMELNVAAYLNLLILGRVRVILVSPDLMTRQATRLGFDCASTIEQAIEMVATKMPEATVNVLPLGGVIVPLVKDELTFS